MTQYDVVIVGGGQAGVPLAFALASAGKRAALIERKHLGGSCVNFGCTPTKAAIASARVAHLARRAADFGVRVPAVVVFHRNAAIVAGIMIAIAVIAHLVLEQRICLDCGSQWRAG